MRLVHGAAQGASLHDHWAAMRDCPKLARPETPSEAVATGDIHTPMPPSKAHLKRLARQRAALVFVEKLRPYPAPSESCILGREQFNFHQRCIAQLGGSSTVKAAPLHWNPASKAFEA